MAGTNQIIEPENQGTWIAVTFVIALLALAIGTLALQRIWQATAITQGEVVLLKQRIDALQGAAAPAAPAAPAAEQQAQ